MSRNTYLQTLYIVHPSHGTQENKTHREAIFLTEVIPEFGMRFGRSAFLVGTTFILLYTYKHFTFDGLQQWRSDLPSLSPTGQHFGVVDYIIIQNLGHHLISSLASNKVHSITKELAPLSTTSIRA